jgi:hypothetical protein
MADLLAPEERHDPGGKVKTKLPEGMTGTAEFSQCGKYRLVLTRQWGGDEKEPYALFIGMNPSTASADFNDPTITREIGFTAREGFRKYVKCNVGDYRSTDPKGLLSAVVKVCTVENVRTIFEQASGAAIVIMSHGALPKPLIMDGNLITRELLKRGAKLHCLGVTKWGFPRHPLYVKADAPLIPYPCVEAAK